MKRILIPAGGAVLATGLLAAGLAGTATAASDVATDPMAASAANAKAIAAFWADNNAAALKAATESNVWDNKTDVAKLQSKGGYSADTKPGSTAPIGYETKKTVKYQNVNIPKTLGKVFFVNSKGEKKWCSATSIQSKYRNTVATAGHCVYDTANNTDVMSKWVFVPMYYQGKAPAGIYVGKQAFTHYDFDTYEDYDRDYAFVTVYNGVNVKTSGGDAKQVDRVTYDNYKGDKSYKDVKITEADYKKCVLDPKSFCFVKDGSPEKVVGPDYPGAVVDKSEVRKAKYDAAATGRGQGYKFGEPIVEQVDQAAYKAYKGPGTKGKDATGNYTITHYYVQKWFLPGTDAEYYGRNFYIKSDITAAVTDAGRLGDNVGGQGFAWNQPTGKAVRVFGYPAAAHPDGNKAYTGVTPKWCYGTTSKKLVGSAAKKIEEHIALKCAMTEGADGGPWLAKYSNAKRIGYVNGVTSTFNDQDGNGRVDYISSPYFDGETATVYKSASNVWSGKIV